MPDQNGVKGGKRFCSHGSIDGEILEKRLSLPEVQGIAGLLQKHDCPENAEIDRLLQHFIGQGLRHGVGTGLVPEILAVELRHTGVKGRDSGQMLAEGSGAFLIGLMDFRLGDDAPAVPGRPGAAGDAAVGLSALVPRHVAPAAFLLKQFFQSNVETGHYAVTPVMM